MVPRLDADALVDAVALHVPAGRVPVRAAGRRRTAPAAATSRSSSSSTRASSTTAATGRSRPTTRRPRPRRSSSASSVRNAGPEPATIDVLPDAVVPQHVVVGRRHVPSRRSGSRAARSSPSTRTSARASSRASGSAEALFCENETNTARFSGEPPATPYPKDGIADHVVHGAATVNPDARPARRPRSATGSRSRAGETATVELRLGEAPGLGRRLRVRDGCARARGRRVLRRAHARRRHPRTRRSCCARRSPGCSGRSSSSTTTCCAGCEGDPAGPPPPDSRWGGRNSEWTHLNNMDVISMPDKWEYPWYAAWDLAFHCVSLAHVDPEFAKSQLILLCREWYMHPNGQLPAYEWSFSRRQPARARVGRAARLRDRRRRGLRVPRAHPPQAAPQLHLVGEPQGRSGQQPLRGRLPRPRQHRRRSTARRSR